MRMNKLIIIILGIVFSLNLQGKELTNWEELSDGLNYNSLPFSYNQIVNLKFNGEILQTENKCATCPFKIEWIGNSNILYKSFKITLIDENLKNNNLFTPSNISIKFKSSSLIYSTLGHKAIDFKIDSDCKEISEIIFNEITNSINNTSKKDTDEEIDLNEVFNKLKNNQLKNWITSLPNNIRQDNSCIETYELLKYIKNGDKEGFALNEYVLSLSLKSYLDNVIGNLGRHLSKYGEDITEVQIKCIGFTDEQLIQNGKFISYDSSDRVYYKSNLCQVNNSTSIKFYKLNESTINYSLVPNKITNNCQLSAVRSKKVINYIKSNLGSSFPNIKVEYSYAPGGVGSGTTYPLQRKINLKLFIKAAQKKQ